MSCEKYSKIWFRNSTKEWVYEYSIETKQINLTSKITHKFKIIAFICGVMNKLFDINKYKSE